jgi:hypothetical protein
VPAFHDGGRDGGNLIGGLPKPEDDFREPLAGRAVVVDPGEAQVGEGLGAEGGQQCLMGVGQGGLAGPDLVEEMAQLFWAHKGVSCLFC